MLVRETLDKLVPIESDLIRTDPKCQSLGFESLLEALTDFTLRNPEKEDTSNRDRKPSNRRELYFRKEKHYRSTEKKPAKCVYCESTDHRSRDCDKVKEVNERREILKNKLC